MDHVARTTANQSRLVIAWHLYVTGQLLPDMFPDVRGCWESEPFADGYAIPGMSAEQVIALGRAVGVEFVS